MSSKSATKIDQKEYLKKYLSGDKVKKKKKKDKKHKKSEASAKVKIIDDDINHLDNGLQIDEELLLTGDDAPQIVGEYIHENPSDANVPKWKTFGVKEEPLDDGVTSSYKEEDLWGRKAGELKIKQELGAGKKRSNKPRDNSPPRRKDRKRHSPSHSPPRRSRMSPSPRRNKKSISPLRQRQNATPDYSPNRGNMCKDQSPPRKSKYERSPERLRKRSPGQSPRRRRRNSDQSPPRKGRDSPKNYRKRSPDQSPPRRKSISNQSPPRKSKIYPNRARKMTPDNSPPRRIRDSTQSPSRKGKTSPRRERKMTPDNSPPRRIRDYDQSPSRRGRKSPRREIRSPRKRNSDLSPPRKVSNSLPNINRNSPTSLIKRENFLQDLLPRQKIKRESPSPPHPPPQRRSRWERQEPEKSLSPPPTHKPKVTKTLEGKKAGLQDAQALQKETLERRKQEDILFEKMSSDISGRNAEIQVRSTGRQGRRAREAKEEDPEERRRKEAHEEKKKQLYDRWGKGLKQIEDHKNRLAEQEHESNKPLARYSNDEDLERHLRDQERVDDPMLEYMRQKRKEKEKLSGKPEVPTYQGSFPENRFGIRPGYRWDGVDRSNGYEKKYFDVQNEKRARQDEAYKYSVEDM